MSVDATNASSASTASSPASSPCSGPWPSRASSTTRTPSGSGGSSCPGARDDDDRAAGAARDDAARAPQQRRAVPVQPRLRRAHAARAAAGDRGAPRAPSAPGAGPVQQHALVDLGDLERRAHLRRRVALHVAHADHRPLRRREARDRAHHHPQRLAVLDRGGRGSAPRVLALLTRIERIHVFSDERPSKRSRPAITPSHAS